MTITAINEQLLRAMGVGIALFGGNALDLRYANEIFQRWFEGEPATDCATLFPKLDVEEMLRATAAGSRFTFEVHRRQRRRTLVLSMIFSHVEIAGEPLIILECQNITRIRELEAMLASYSTMVERNLSGVERERDTLRSRILELLPAGTLEDPGGQIALEAQRVAAASVLVANIRRPQDETHGENVPAQDLLAALASHHGALERIATPLGCERARILGGTYVGVAFGPVKDTLPALTDAAAMFVRYLDRCNESDPIRWTVSIGIDHGELIAGYIGRRARLHDVFGSAVDGAMLASEAARPMEVRLSRRAHRIAEGGLALPHPMTPAADDATAIVDITRHMRL